MRRSPSSTRENFPWWLRFQAFAQTYNFKEALKEDPEDDLPTTEDDDENEEDDAMQAARKRNNDAVYSLTLALGKKPRGLSSRALLSNGQAAKPCSVFPPSRCHKSAGVKALIRRRGSSHSSR
jgi:hypothetical protein